jgi:hypothetical protein
MEGVIDEKEEIFFMVELNLFTFGTITLSKPEILNVVIFNAKANMEDLTFNFSYYELGYILVDIMLSRIIVQEFNTTH